MREKDRLMCFDITRLDSTCYRDSSRCCLRFAVIFASLLLSLIIQSNSPVGIAVLVVAAILLDIEVSANLVLSQRSIFR